MASLGQDLRRERELRGITLQEIAESTKIGLRFFTALEEDKLDLLPGKFFTKSIIRAYANYIGLDENDVLNKYYEMLQFQEQEQEKEFIEKSVSSALPKKIKKWIYIIALSVILLMILLLIYFTVYKRLLLPQEEILQTTFLPKPSSLPQIILHEIIDEKIDSLTLEMFFNQRTWLQVYADGILKVDGIKWPGTQIKIDASQEFLVHLGNAGGFTYTINGKKGKVIGSSGQVVKNISITLDNFQQFLEGEDKQINHLPNN